MSSHVIWKYELEIAQRQTIVMPAGAQILHVREQYNGINEVPTLWVSVLPTEGADAADEERTFEIVGTGGQIPDGHRYLGTTLCGQWVWHVYEVTPQCGVYISDGLTADSCTHAPGHEGGHSWQLGAA